MNGIHTAITTKKPNCQDDLIKYFLHLFDNRPLNSIIFHVSFDYRGEGVKDFMWAVDMAIEAFHTLFLAFQYQIMEPQKML